MEQIFCRVVIAAPGCTTRIEADSERKAADAAESVLRLYRGQTQSVTVEVECADGHAADRILDYLSDLADEWERV